MKSLLTKKSSQSDCVFQLMLGLEEHGSSSPLGDFNKLFEGQLWVLFKIWHWNMIFLMTSIWPLKCILYHCFAGKSKLNAVSSSQSKSKQTGFPWCLMPIGTIQHQDTQSTVLTNSSVLVASVVNGGWRWQPQQNLLNSGLSPICLLVSFNAEVLVVVLTVGCVQGSWSQVPTFICYSPLPLTQNASKGFSKQFPGTCTIIQIKYVCQSCVTCPSIHTDPGISPPGSLAFRLKWAGGDKNGLGHFYPWVIMKRRWFNRLGRGDKNGLDHFYPRGVRTDWGKNGLGHFYPWW